VFLTVYLKHDLVYANDIFQRGDGFLEAFADAVHVGHEFEVVVLAMEAIKPIKKI
jgi:hypothetical protein